MVELTVNADNSVVLWNVKNDTVVQVIKVEIVDCESFTGTLLKLEFNLTHSDLTPDLHFGDGWIRELDCGDLRRVLVFSVEQRAFNTILEDKLDSSQPIVLFASRPDLLEPWNFRQVEFAQILNGGPSEINFLWVDELMLRAQVCKRFNLEKLLWH